MRQSNHFIYNVELNGEGVWAELNGNTVDFAYGKFNGNTDVNENVVNQTAQMIYNYVKMDGRKNSSYYVGIFAEFKDEYLKGLIDADYSEDFVPVSKYNFYSDNNYKYPYGIEDEQVEYDRDEVEYDILEEYGELYKNYCDSFYKNWVEEKLDELGFEELCKEKGIDVDILFCYDTISVSSFGDEFVFRMNLYLKYYDRDDNE